MIIKQLSIFVENKPGRLAEVAAVIGDAGVDIRALSLADTSDFGILRLIVNKPEEAIAALKQASLTVTLTDVIAVALDDKPGSFSRVIAVLSAAGISIEYSYAFISRKESQAFLILRIEDAQQGVQALQKGGVRLLSSDEVYSM